MIKKPVKETIRAKGIDITIYTRNFQDEYMSLTDIARYKNTDYPSDVINNWMRNRNTVEYLGIWEHIHNPDFNSLEFEGIDREAGRNAFVLTPKRWIETTAAIGMTSKQGRYAATFAHKDIALKFAAWLSPEFELYIIKDYQRLKSDDSSRLSLNWNLNREISKLNYRIHTDAIKENLIPPQLTSYQISITLANWTGVAYKIPRTKLDSCKGRDDLSQSGVYFLFGISDQTGESVVYIGQAGVRKNGEGILYRLQEHKRNPEKDYWTEAVVFTTSNNSFGPTEISYLENRFTNIAKETERYVVKNGNDPTPGNITEEKESELEEFIDYAKIIMGTLGHKVFEPLTASVTTIAPNNDSSEGDDVIFYIKRSGADAKGKLTTEGFVVLAGSKIRMDIVPSCPDYVKSERKNSKDNIDDNGIIRNKMLFKSPSSSAAFVLGTSANGNIEWRTEDGKILKDVENSDVG